ncbi:MAG: hypothetical protein JWR27_628 [Aeromicrobium sp.]|nr:hypothetical protein [Aeromicrobium sp.]
MAHDDEHERAHVRTRHDLVLEAFDVLHRAFPRPLRTDAPLRQSPVLVELMADDAARKVAGRQALARAIVALAGAATPAGALGAGSAALVRLERLRDDTRPHRWAGPLSLMISLVVLVAPAPRLADPRTLSS